MLFVLSALALLALSGLSALLIIPNFSIEKFAPKGLCGKSDKDLPALQGNPGFCPAQFSAGKIWDDPTQPEKLLGPVVAAG